MTGSLPTRPCSIPTSESRGRHAGIPLGLGAGSQDPGHTVAQGLLGTCPLLSGVQATEREGTIQTIEIQMKSKIKLVNRKGLLLHLENLGTLM